MASIIRQATCTIPAGTPKSALVSIPITLPGEQQVSVDLEVPPGPAGLMGFYLAMSGTQVIPFEFGEFIVWDDRFDSWVLDDYPTTGAWSLVGYNLDDANAHSVVVRFHDEPLPAPAMVTPTVTIVTTPVAQPLVTL